MKKGQFWYGDFLVAVLILMVIGLLFVSSIVDITSRNEVMEELILDASDISSLLMNDGVGTPDDWENGEGTVGFVSNYRINKTSLDGFLTLNYNTQREMLGTFNNVWIYIADRTGRVKESNGQKIGGIYSINDINADNIISIKRFVFYDDNNDGKGDIYVLGVVIWK